MNGILKKDGFFLSLLVLIVLISILPFIEHAYHIDEPLFLKIAEQIKKDFFRPYDFLYLWNDTYLPMDQIAAFPPFFSYYLALVRWLSNSFSEWIIHLSLIPFALLGAFSFYGICKRLNFSSEKSFFATALLVVSPSFVLTSNLAMPDLAALSLLLAALYLLFCSSSSFFSLILSGILLGASTLLRYNFLPFIPVFFLLSYSFPEFRKRRWIPSLIAAFLFLIWIVWSSKGGKATHSTTIFSNFLNLDVGLFIRLIGIHTHLVFSTFLPFFFVLFLKLKKKIWISILIFSMGVSTIVLYFKAIYFSEFIPLILSISFGLFTFIFALKFSFSTFRKMSWKFSFLEKQKEVQISLLFLGGFFSLFIPLIYINFASKFIILIQPFLILMLLHQVNLHSPMKKLSLQIAIPCLLIFSCLLARADFSYANLYREEARSRFHSIKKQYPEAKIWFAGHWGWQYYLEQLGAFPISSKDFKFGKPQKGDFILKADNNCPQPIPLLEEDLKTIGEKSYSPSLGLRTMSFSGHAGFYSTGWGLFPYSISGASLETFRTLQVNDLSRKSE